MEPDRKEFAPVLLFGIAAIAFVVTLGSIPYWSSASEHENRPSHYRQLAVERMHQRRAMSVTLGPAPKVASPAIAEPEPLLAEASPEALLPVELLPIPESLLSSCVLPPLPASEPIDFSAMTIGGGIDPSATFQTSEIVLLVSDAPRWTAAWAGSLSTVSQAENWQRLAEKFAGWKSDQAAFQLGQAWGGLNRRLHQAFVTPRIATRPSANGKQAGTILSPPSLAGPQVSGPEDRLAMSNKRSQAAPRQTIRRRSESSASKVFKRVESSARVAKRQLAVRRPTVLLEQVRQLKESSTVVMWAIEVEAELEALSQVPSGDEAAVERHCHALVRLAAQGRDLATVLDAPLDPSPDFAADDSDSGTTGVATATRLRRVGYGIDRRIKSWKLAASLHARQQAFALTVPVNTDERLRERLQAAAQELAVGQTGGSWLRYLQTTQMSDQLGNRLGEEQLATPQGQKLAQQILVQMTRGKLVSDRSNRPSFGPVAVIGNGMPSWTNQQVDASQLMGQLEQYESVRSPELAHRIARDTRWLSDSGTALNRELAEEINQKYRNANLRVAVASGMVQRMLPSPKPRTSPIRDQLFGASVRGSSTTHTQLNVSFTPHPHALRFGLEARGWVDTQTASMSGPVVLRSEGTTKFAARKQVAVLHNGLRVWPTDCNAQGDHQLVGMRTDYDRVPLIGNLVRSRAKDEYATHRMPVRNRMEDRVRQQVAETLDQESDPLLAKLRSRYSMDVLNRAEHLGLQIEPVELRTTPKRMIARVRIANQQQLGAHTPRNRAPSDSLLSLQMHESAMNNAARGLQLSGQAFTPETFRGQIRERLQLPKNDSAEEAEKAEFEFADRDPIRIKLADGKVELIMSIKQMQVGRNRFRDFKVHASYVPEAVGMQAQLRRVGTPGIEGKMRTASRIRLHGIFGKVLGDDEPITLLKPRDGDHRFDGLMITQLVTADGWLGIAVGEATPSRVATIGRYVR